MDTAQENHLRDASSAYLRAARRQPVDWREWNEDAFAEAERLGKPVLLDIGATWCHWCQVMDRESYNDPQLAALINELFVAIKVDRDERPDVDARYQAAVSAISGQGGWPLTAFLTPEGKPYFGGTYFSREERYGRPSFLHVLHSMASAFQKQRAEVEESAASVMEAIEQGETFSERGGTLDQALLERMISSMLEQFDARNGGFGSQPKFPHAAALDLLIDTGSQPGPLAARARQVVETSLLRMAAGGFHDQLAGGFHRYSVDEGWVVPHFEKMSADNSELLRVYVHAFSTFGDVRFAEVARQLVAWMDACLSDRERGGFYASQDADVSIDDDGAYFTWTRAEAQAVLTAEEFGLAERYFHLRPVGHMHGNPAKNVLRTLVEKRELAAALHLPEAEVSRRLTEIRARLLAARLQRPAPFIDRTMYSGWNGLCISAYLAAGEALGQEETTAFALRSLDRVLGSAWDAERGLSHVVAYGRSAGQPVRIPGVLDDYLSLALATLDAWEITEESRYLAVAQEMAKQVLDRFYDAGEGGFFDTEQGGGQRLLGALLARRKPLQDAPTPAGNPQAATLLLRLHKITGDPHLREAADHTLGLFAGVAEHLGLYAASYGGALRRLILAPGQGEATQAPA